MRCTVFPIMFSLWMSNCKLHIWKAIEMWITVLELHQSVEMLKNWWKLFLRQKKTSYYIKKYREKWLCGCECDHSKIEVHVQVHVEQFLKCERAPHSKIHRNPSSNQKYQQNTVAVWSRKKILSTIDPPPGVPGVSKNHIFFFTNEIVFLLR